VRPPRLGAWRAVVLPSADAWPARQRLRHCALSEAPGLTVSGFGLLTVPMLNYNRINMRSMFGLFFANCGVVCGQFHFPLHAQGVDCALPGRRPVTGAVRKRNPQHFHRARTDPARFCTRHPHVCAQKAVAAPGPARPPVGRSGRAGTASRRLGIQSCGRARGWPAGTFPPPESDKAPPCMRWRGLPRPRRAKPTSRPCWRRAPPAGAGYPCQGRVARFLERSRGRPRVVPVSSGESISTASAGVRARARGQEFQVSRLFTRHPQKAGSYPQGCDGYPPPCSQSVHRLSGMSREYPVQP
jgi:hypothetical protein